MWVNIDTILTKLFLTKDHTLFRFLLFYLFFFSVFDSHPGYHITFIGHISLRPSALWQFLRLLFWMTLRQTGQVFGKVLFTLGCPVFSSWLDCGYGYWGGRWQSLSAMLLTSVKGAYCQYDNTAEVNLDRLGEVVSDVSPCKRTLFTCFSSVPFGKMSLCTIHRMWCSTCLREQYLYKLFEFIFAF